MKDGATYQYGYDPLYQLTSVDKDSTPTESFTYDPVGNRETSIDYNFWEYDDNNRLLSYGGSTFFTYDDNGNTATEVSMGVTKNFGYSIDDRMVSLSDPSNNYSYSYDPMGRRISKTVNDVTTKFLWEGDIMLAEMDDANNITRVYLTNPDTYEPLAIGDWPLGLLNWNYQLTDHLMTPMKMADSGQNIVWSAEYKAFGEVEIDPASTVINNIRFPGQYWDEESGLHYNIQRYYLAGSGRYISVDYYNIASILSILPHFYNPYSVAWRNVISKSAIFPWNYSNLNMDYYCAIDLYDLLANSLFTNYYIINYNNTINYFDFLGLSCGCKPMRDVNKARKIIDANKKCKKALNSIDEADAQLACTDCGQACRLPGDVSSVGFFQSVCLKMWREKQEKKKKEKEKKNKDISKK